MHDAGNTLKSRFFLQSYVAVAFEDDGVSFAAYDAVDQDVTSDVAYKGDSAFADVLVFPWTEGDLVAQVHQEWVHAVAFDSDGHGLPFSDESADLLVHCVLVYAYLSAVFHIPCCAVQKYG